MVSFLFRRSSRRRFLQTVGISAASLWAAGCQSAGQQSDTLPPGTAAATAPAAGTTSPYPVPSPVAIAQASDYDPKRVREQVQTLIDGLGGLRDVVHPGDRVAIKVNLTGGASIRPLPGVSPVESFVTHPQVVQALGELVRDAGAKQIYIVESVYGLQAYSVWGYTEMAKAIGATLIDLETPDPYPDFSTLPVGAGWYIYPQFTMNRLLTEVDAFMSVAKMKCHWTAGVTNAMKNLVGLVPVQHYRLSEKDTNRTAFHGSGEEYKTRIPRIVVDLNRARPIHFSLLDGVKTVEGGEGPWVNISPIESGVLIAGKNPVATDAVATAVMGFDPTVEPPTAPFLRADNYLNMAYKLGLGTNRLEEIEVVGTPIKDVRRAFKPGD